MPDSEQWPGVWQWPSDGSTVNPEDLQISSDLSKYLDGNDLDINVETIEQPRHFAAIEDQDSEAGMNDQHTEEDRILNDPPAPLDEINPLLDITPTKMQDQEGTMTESEDPVESIVVQQDTQDQELDVHCHNENHVVDNTNEFSDQGVAAEQHLSLSLAANESQGDAEGLMVGDSQDGQADPERNEHNIPTLPPYQDSEPAVDGEDDNNDGSIKVETGPSDKKADAATASSEFPKGQSSPGFVPIGTPGVANAEQGNALNFDMAQKVRIVAAERDFIPPLSYPQIAAKYPTWGVTQSRLRGMVYKAPGRLSAADTKRVKDPWTFAGVSLLSPRLVQLPLF